MLQLGIEPEGNTPEEFARVIATEIPLWQGVWPRPTTSSQSDMPETRADLLQWLYLRPGFLLRRDEREQFQGLLHKLCAGLEPQARTKLLPPGC